MENLANKQEKESEIELKEATELDIPTLVSLEEKVANVKTYSPMLTQEEWHAEISKNGKVYLIARNESLVGDTSYERENEDSACISGLVIIPEFQGQGLGRMAMEKVLAELSDVKKIWLVVHPENDSAVKLYESLGFIRGEVKENYFDDGEPRMVMIKENKS